MRFGVVTEYYREDDFSLLIVYKGFEPAFFEFVTSSMGSLVKVFSRLLYGTPVISNPLAVALALAKSSQERSTRIPPWAAPWSKIPKDDSPLTVLGPEWFTDAYTQSPGGDWLVTLFGGEHMLGGISGYLVTETTDESPERVAAVQRLTCAYLQSALDPGDESWAEARAAFAGSGELVGRIHGK